MMRCMICQSGNTAAAAGEGTTERRQADLSTSSQHARNLGRAQPTGCCCFGSCDIIWHVQYVILHIVPGNAQHGFIKGALSAHVTQLLAAAIRLHQQVCLGAPAMECTALLRAAVHWSSLSLHCWTKCLLACSMSGVNTAACPLVPVCIFACSVLGLDVSRQEPVAPERVHKMRGITTVPASAEVRQQPPSPSQQLPDCLARSMQPQLETSWVLCQPSIRSAHCGSSTVHLQQQHVCQHAQRPRSCVAAQCAAGKTVQPAPHFAVGYRHNEMTQTRRVTRVLTGLLLLWCILPLCLLLCWLRSHLIL